MPQLLTVHVGRRHRRPVRVWIPVLPVAVVLAPLIVLAAAVACLIFHISVPRAFGTGWRVVSALPGTRFDLEQGHTAFLVSIR